MSVPKTPKSLNDADTSALKTDASKMQALRDPAAKRRLPPAEPGRYAAIEWPNWLSRGTSKCLQEIDQILRFARREIGIEPFVIKANQVLEVQGQTIVEIRRAEFECAQRRDLERRNIGPPPGCRSATRIGHTHRVGGIAPIGIHPLPIHRAAPVQSENRKLCNPRDGWSEIVVHSHGLKFRYANGKSRARRVIACADLVMAGRAGTHYRVRNGDGSTFGRT